MTVVVGVGHEKPASVLARGDEQQPASPTKGRQRASAVVSSSMADRTRSSARRLDGSCERGPTLWAAIVDHRGRSRGGDDWKPGSGAGGVEEAGHESPSSGEEHGDERRRVGEVVKE
ncbi:hypothetical protein PF004_g27574 [Phytophthora fragariae]|uniref:Uncharacterized protein n=1 Tax=Phytophthora fragariae TaxID=53985 RepID=A0A6G0ML94_9STRA|nr:hypothetical protein PF004_g27574 [Phytophthora fragariae]